MAPCSNQENYDKRTAEIFRSLENNCANGENTAWDQRYADLLEEYGIPVYEERVIEVTHTQGSIQSIHFHNGLQVSIAYLFATRGDLSHNELARSLGARLNTDGEIEVDEHMRTSVTGLYAAGCVTPANCQMIIAAGQGSSAAQAIHHDLFEELPPTHSLRQYRQMQL